MLAACCSILVRSGFLTLATPLLLAGSIFHQVALRLQVQSTTSFEYALAEFAAAGEAQVLADGALEKAVVDQTVVDELGADSLRQEGVAARDEAAAGRSGEQAQAGQQAGAGEAAEAAEAGDAAGAAKAAHAAATADRGSGLAGGFADAVESTAAKAAAKTAAAGAAGEAVAAGTGAAEAGAGAAAGAGAQAGDAGLEAAAAEAAGAALVGTGGAAAPMVAIGMAGTAAVVEGPAAIAAAEEQWGAASAEIQAARDEVMIAEKEAEAAALEAGAAVYEEGSLAAVRAATASLASGVGALAASQAFHLVALAVQAPVALIVLHQKFSTAGLTLYGAANGPACGPALAAGAATNVLLAASLGLALGGPWARTVTAAAAWEAAYFDVQSIPDLVGKALPFLNDRRGGAGSHAGAGEQKERAGADAAQDSEAALAVRRLWGWQDFAHDVIDSGRDGMAALHNTGEAAWNATGSIKEAAHNATGAIEGVLAKGEAVAEDAEASAADAVNKSPVAPYVKVAKRATENASRAVTRAVDAEVRAARNATMRVAKKVLVPKPNTATTTVAPLTTPALPEVKHFWSFLLPSLEGVGRSVLHWVAPVLADVALLSLAFGFCELVVSAGRHLPQYRSGFLGHTSLLGCLLHDVSARWMQGMGLLVAVWLLSIVLAPKLRPYAEAAQEFFDGPAGLATFAISCACCVACAYHAHLLSKLECPCAAKPGTGTCCDPKAYTHVVSDEEQPEEQSEALLRTPQQQSLGQGCQLREQRGPQCPQQKHRRGMELQGFADHRLAPDSGKDQQEASECLCVEVSCLGAALASAAGAVLGLVEAPMVSWAFSSSLQSFLASQWLMGFLPWELVASHVLPGWPHCLVSSPWPLVAAAIAASGLVGFLLTLAQRGAES